MRSDSCILDANLDLFRMRLHWRPNANSKLDLRSPSVDRGNLFECKPYTETSKSEEKWKYLSRRRQKLNQLSPLTKTTAPLFILDYIKKRIFQTFFCYVNSAKYERLKNGAKSKEREKTIESSFAVP